MLTKRTETERAGSCSLHAVGSARGMARPLSIESPGDLQPPEGRVLSEIRPPQRRAPAKPLPECARLHPDSGDVMGAAYTSGGCTLKEVGEYFGLHDAQVSRIVSRVKSARSKTLLARPRRSRRPPSSPASIFRWSRRPSSRSVRATPARWRICSLGAATSCRYGPSPDIATVRSFDSCRFSWQNSAVSNSGGSS